MAKKPGGRAFGQDLGHGEGNVAPAKGVMKRGKPKMGAQRLSGGNLSEQMAGGKGTKRADAKTFGTAVQLGGGNFNDQLVGKKKVDTTPGGGGGGAFIRNDGKRADPKYAPDFQAKKKATEAVLGRELTDDEFAAEHYVAEDAPTAMGTSIFDPVLCELVYRWWCPPGGLIIDPFAGGSVRGVVAGILGRQYVGIDLRAEQVLANRIQAETIFAAHGGEGRPKPEWLVGDSTDALPALEATGIEADFVFSCPPYADLEVYSENPLDLSTMAYPDFLAAYTVIIERACARLKENRFACFVVGDVRDSSGCYRSFPQHTIVAFEAAGLRLYNDAILVTAAGSLPVRAGRQFAASRKLGTTHQRVLVFVKGDPKKAAEAVGPVEFGELPRVDDAPVAEDGAPEL